MPEKEFLEIDGSHGEAGGQIARTAVALASLTQQPIRVTNIRLGRPKPGLKAQHLNAIKALEQLCGARAEGAEVGSTELRFWPGLPKGKSFEIDIGTAGSITLLLQALLLPCCFADKKVKLTIIGGTDTSWSPQYQYLVEVLVPHLRKYVERIDMRLLKRGYYPKGGGKVEVEVVPKKDWARKNFPTFDSFWNELQKKAPKIELLEQGTLLFMKGVSHAAKFLQQRQVAERIAEGAKVALKGPADIRIEYADAFSPGCGITLWAGFGKENQEVDEANPVLLGADQLGEKGVPAETVGRKAAEKLLDQINSGAAVDEHLEDNIIPWLALCCPSAMRVPKLTPHTRTNMYVVERFLGKVFTVDEDKQVIRTICPK